MSKSAVAVRQATIADLDAIAPLFDAYRVFYRKPSDLAGARSFLHARFAHLESVIFLAELEARVVGFTQLYPSFSSASMAPIFVFNDLFVAPDARKSGAGSALIKAAADFARRAGAVRLTLQTEVANTAAQSLYEREGWTRDTVFCGYQLAL